MPSKAKVYLGDGCYAQWDGYNITLTTSDGVEDTNTVVLEPDTLDAFEQFIIKLKQDLGYD